MTKISGKRLRRNWISNSDRAIVVDTQKVTENDHMRFKCGINQNG